LSPSRAGAAIRNGRFNGTCHPPEIVGALRGQRPFPTEVHHTAGG
jgi:hypothetical protein